MLVDAEHRRIRIDAASSVPSGMELACLLCKQQAIGILHGWFVVRSRLSTRRLIDA